MEFNFEEIALILLEVNNLNSHDVNIKDWLETNYPKVYYACVEDSKFNINHVFNKSDDLLPPYIDFTLSDIAAWCKYNNAEQALVSSGARINQSYKSTLLHHAAAKGWKDVVEYLAKNRIADLNATDKSGWTPLHYATRYGHKNIVETLVQEKAKVNVRTKDGATPLHFAVNNDLEANHCTDNDLIDMVKLLVKNGADVHATNCEGYTPLDLASNNRVKKILKNAMKAKNNSSEAAKLVGAVGIIIGIVTIAATAALLTGNPMIVGLVIGAVVACLGLVGVAYGVKKSPDTKVDEIERKHVPSPEAAKAS